MISLRKRIFVYIIVLITIVSVAIVTIHSYMAYSIFLSHIRNQTKQTTEFYAQKLVIKDNIIINEHVLDGEQNRITIINRDGDVIYDNKVVNTSNNHNYRQEVIEARESSYGDSRRYSTTVSKETFFYAIENRDGYVIRTAISSSTLFAVLLSRAGLSLGVISAILALCYVFTLIISRHITNSITKYEEIAPLLNTIKKQSVELESNLHTLQAITDNMVEGLMIVDSNNQVLTLNKSITRILKVNKDNYINKHVLELFNTLNISKRFSDEIKTSNKIEINNSYYNVLTNKVIVDDNYIGKIILFIDITKEEKVSKIRREFSSNVSHELKTPLASILGYSELIENGLVDEEKKSDFIAKIRFEASSMNNLIDDILLISSLDEKSTTFEMKEENISEMIDDILSRLNHKIASKNILVVLDVKTRFHYVNYRLIYEAIYNLIDNAINYNIENGTIKISTKDSITIKVSNTGVEIPKHEQQRIFERFYRVDKSRNKRTGGYGLGLAIVKHSVLAHNGSINIKSKNGYTTFELII